MVDFIEQPFSSDLTSLYLDKNTRIKKLLAIPPNKRTKFDIIELNEHLGDNVFLNQFKETGQLKKLCRKIEMTHYEPNRVVFNQGDPGDWFYVVLDGRVGIYIRRQGDSDGQRVADYKQGDSFGDLALISGKPRMGDALTLETTTLIRLNKLLYDKVIRRKTEDQIDSNFQNLKSFPIFWELNEELIQHFARTSIYKRFISNHTILKQGELATHVYVIFSGVVRLSMRIDALNGKQVVIDELQQGDSFGEYSILYNAPLQYSVTTVMPCTIMCIEKTVVQNHDPELMWQFQAKCKPYPTEQELYDNYVKLQQWKKYKSEISKNVFIENTLRKRNFNKRLRLPEIMPNKSIKASVRSKSQFDKPTKREGLITQRTQDVKRRSVRNRQSRTFVK